MGEVEVVFPYPLDDSSDVKVSSDQALSQSAIHFPAPKVFHCTLYVNAPLGEGTHELHLFTLEVLLRAGLGEYTQNNTDGEEGCQDRASLRGEGLRMKEKSHDVQGSLVKNGQPPSFSVSLRGVPVFLECSVGSWALLSLAWRRTLFSHSHNKPLPTSNQLHPWPAYGPPGVQWPSATASETDAGIAKPPASHSESPGPVIGLEPDVSEQLCDKETVFRSSERPSQMT